MNRLLLVDGNSVCWRNFHKLAALSYQGIPTGAAYGFLRTLRAALEDTKATGCRVAWDGGRSAFRMKLWPEYKARRRERSGLDREVREDVRAQMDWLSGVLPGFGVGTAICRGWEADDILGMWVVDGSCSPSSQETVILTGDRDLWQLVRERVSVRMPDGEEVSAAAFERVTGFKSPVQWFWYRVLTGDTSDGIPGVGGIGEKRGRELIAKGFPARGTMPPEWWAAREKPVARNQALMDLHAAGKRLLAFRQRGGPALEWEEQAPARDLAKAQRALTTAGMASLAARWSEWAEPFRRLRS